MIDIQEGHADGIAGRAPQARDGDLPYLAGYISGGLERLALQIAEVKAAVAQAMKVPRMLPPIEMSGHVVPNAGTAESITFLTGARDFRTGIVTPPPIPHAMHGGD